MLALLKGKQMRITSYIDAISVKAKMNHVQENHDDALYVPGH